MPQSGDEEMFLVNSWCEERHGIYTEVSEACSLESNHRDSAVSFRVNFDGILPMLLTFIYDCFLNFHRNITVFLISKIKIHDFDSCLCLDN